MKIFTCEILWGEVKEMTKTWYVIIEDFEHVYQKGKANKKSNKRQQMVEECDINKRL